MNVGDDLPLMNLQAKDLPAKILAVILARILAVIQAGILADNLRRGFLAADVCQTFSADAMLNTHEYFMVNLMANFLATS